MANYKQINPTYPTENNRGYHLLSKRSKWDDPPMANPWAPLSIQPPTKSSCQKSLAPRFVCMVCLEALGTLGDNIQQKKGKNKKQKTMVSRGI